MSGPPQRGVAARLASRLLNAVAYRRVQLVGGLLLSALPALIRWPSRGGETHLFELSLSPPDQGITNALIGGVFATLLGFITLRQLKTHPGVASVGYVFYAFAMTYGGLSLLLLFLRADYSRYQLITSFALTLIWFLFTDIITTRRTRLAVGLIPSLGFRPPPSSPRIDWVYLTEPQIDTERFGSVVADFRAELPAEWVRFVARCALAGLPVYDIRQIRESTTGRVEIEHLSENTLGATLHGLVYARLKRGLDLLGVLLATPFALIILAFAVVAIRAEGGGPALFTQRRMGYQGREFTIFKLRTMRVEGERRGQQFTRQNDPRITAVGKYLRKYRIDEIPQIWNILKGEMSWIGPRPEAVALSEWYEREVPFYSYRHMVRPGISGWAQVNQGNVAKIGAATDKLHYDFYYIKHMSPWLDLLITAKTIQTVLTGFGAL